MFRVRYQIWAENNSCISEKFFLYSLMYFVCLCESAIIMTGVVSILCQTILKQRYRHCFNPILYNPLYLPLRGSYKYVITYSVVYSFLLSGRGDRSCQTFRNYLSSGGYQESNLGQSTTASDELELPAQPNVYYSDSQQPVVAVITYNFYLLLCMYQ